MIIRVAEPADAAALARVHVDSWRQTYAGILAPEILANLSYDSRERWWAQILAEEPRRTTTFLAETDAGETVGFVAAGENREADGVYAAYAGEIYALYLLDAFQGRGWGKELLLHAGRELAQAGYHSYMLWVLADNPSRGFYEALGGEELGQKEIEMGGHSYREIAYGWR